MNDDDEELVSKKSKDQAKSMSDLKKLTEIVKPCRAEGMMSRHGKHMEAEMENVYLGIMGGRKIHTEEFKRELKLKKIEQAMNNEGKEFTLVKDENKDGYESGYDQLMAGEEYLNNRAQAVSIVKKKLKGVKSLKTASQIK